MMQNDAIHVIIPPWGGELLIEMLEHTDFRKIKNKWVMGYSDTSTLLLAITLNTGIATAHGPNFVDLRGNIGMTPPPCGKTFWPREREIPSCSALPHIIKRNGSTTARHPAFFI